MIDRDVRRDLGVVAVNRQGGGIGLALVAVVAWGANAEQDRLAAFLSPAPETALAPAERPAQPVRVTTVLLAPHRALLSFTGTVRPHNETAIGVRQPGKVVARLVDLGDAATAGETLARLDDTNARLDLTAAEAEVLAASTNLTRAEADAQRSHDLFAGGHIATAALDLAINGEAEARSRLDRAQRAADLAGNRLSYMVLTAEAGGVVTAAVAEVGRVVTTGQPIVSVARLEGLDAVFALPEQMRGALDDATATAQLWDSDGPSYALTLRDVSPDVDAASRTYRVRMTIRDPDASVSLGRTLTITLARKGGVPVARLPLAAVFSDDQDAAVWRLASGRTQVERVTVRIAALEGGTAMVYGGLLQGDVVVSPGASKIEPSRPMRVVETTALPAN